jgi:SAM-dependent methyltransferase
MDGSNREQIGLWNGTSGLRWVAHQESLDRAWKPIGDLALARAAVLPGERVVDIGCGCGATSLELAAKVGPSGSVLGIDVSGPMLARARERAQALGAANLEFLQADASTHAFDGRADLVFSRAGIMFFEDPVAAFENLRRALRPGGRVVFVCFRDRELNAWMTVPQAAAAAVVGREAQTAPDAPGPFSLAEEARLWTVLGGAGFADVLCQAIDRDVVLGPELDSATDFAVDAGPVARLLVDAPDDVRVRVRAAVAQVLAPRAGVAGVSLRAAVWIVQARNPT